MFYSMRVMAMAAQKTTSVSLQLPHHDTSPALALATLARECKDQAIESFDVYGDFTKATQESFLRTFESNVAGEFGMDDAVFMPSGVMAQGIALLIHSSSSKKATTTKYFACHHSSHLILHEDDAYRELLYMEPLIISTRDQVKNGYDVPPLSFQHVQSALERHKTTTKSDLVGDTLSTLILELPHRELGGKMTPWNDVLQIRDLCQTEHVKLHCDGARIFEASAGYGHKSLKELTEPFDSVYISFYKGLGGLSGAMLLGSFDFCAEARRWLRRFGGNLYTLLPYAVSGMIGYRNNWINPAFDFSDKRDKLVKLVSLLSSDANVKAIVTFDPTVPQVNTVHGYMRHSADAVMAACAEIESETGIRVLTRLRDIMDTESPFDEGYRSRFEWAIGNANVVIPDETFLDGWRKLAAALNNK